MQREDSASLPDVWSKIEQFFTSQPDHPALTSTKLRLTYRMLQDNIRKLTLDILKSLPESYRYQPRCIVLHLPNSVAYVLSMLTCVAMRQPFTPLPVDWPEEKIQMVLEDVKGSVVLTTNTELQKGKFPKHRVLTTIKCDDVMEEDLYLIYMEEYEGQIELSKQCCYVIYTSGSTGRPKGVQCVRSGVMNLARGQIEFWDLCPADVTGQFASVAYDAVISEVFTVFVSGGTLAVIYPDQRLGDELVDTVEALGITVITFVPSLLEVLDPEDFPTIRKLVTAGEACSRQLAMKWYGSGQLRFFNAYGPAENTVCASMYEFTKEKMREEDGHSQGEGLPIGSGMRGVETRLLDPHLREVPEGSEGEIYIGGLSLSLGYIGHATDQTADRFIPDPKNPEARLYKTGDLAVKDSRGDLTFRGRVDHQIKIRGQMVNMTGIETDIKQCPGVELVAVVCQETGPSGLPGPRLVAFISPKSLDLNQLKERLRQRLSSHEMPQAFKLMDSKDFPRNASDKIDRKVLERTPLKP